jgi:hypothetical protein
MSMGKRNRLSRGDARRNARLLRLRGVVRYERAILAIDLADTAQALVVCDHDSRVLARRSVRGRAWRLEEALGWGRQVAVQHGLPGSWWAVSRPGTAGGSSLSCATGWDWTWCACSRCWWLAPASKKTSPGPSPTPKTPS